MTIALDFITALMENPHTFRLVLLELCSMHPTMHVIMRTMLCVHARIFKLPRQAAPQFPRLNRQRRRELNPEITLAAQALRSCDIHSDITFACHFCIASQKSSSTTILTTTSTMATTQGTTPVVTTTSSTPQTVSFYQDWYLRYHFHS